MYDSVYHYVYNTLDAQKLQNGDTNIPILSSCEERKVLVDRYNSREDLLSLAAGGKETGVWLWISVNVFCT